VALCEITRKNLMLMKMPRSAVPRFLFFSAERAPSGRRRRRRRRFSSSSPSIITENDAELRGAECIVMRYKTQGCETKRVPRRVARSIGTSGRSFFSL